MTALDNGPAAQAASTRDSPPGTNSDASATGAAPANRSRGEHAGLRTRDRKRHHASSGVDVERTRLREQQLAQPAGHRMRRRKPLGRNPHPEGIAGGACSTDRHRRGERRITHDLAHVEAEPVRRDEIGDVVELGGRCRPGLRARRVEPDEGVEEHDEGAALRHEAVDGAQHRALQHRGVDDEEHVEAVRQRVREVGHHREIDRRAAARRGTKALRAPSPPRSARPEG